MENEYSLLWGVETILVTMIQVFTMKLFPILLLFAVFQVTVTTACSEVTPIDSKVRQQTIDHACKPLYTAVKMGKINVVKKLLTKNMQESQLTCIKYAMQQRFASLDNNQFLAFRYLVEKLIAMKLPEQQTILNKLLRDYAITYLSASPSYTEYLLSVGALSKTPNEFGELPATTALGTVNDYGNCNTPKLLINASSPEVLALQNKTGKTALMQSIGKGLLCSDEFNLLAQKSAGLNLVDHTGNTSLHYLLMEMKRAMDSGGEVDARDLALLRILRRRGASMKIPNKQSLTSSQLLSYLKKKGCKC